MKHCRILTYVTLALIGGMLAIAAPVSAASMNDQIWSDAADGVINGDYTIAQLRAANANVPAELREYGGWDEAYSDALRRKSATGTTKAPAPVDSNHNGKIDPVEVAAAQKAADTHAGTPITGASNASPTARSCSEQQDESCSETAAAQGDDDADDSDDDDGSPLIWIIVGVPLLIIAIGGVRMLRSRRSSTPSTTTPDDDED